MNSDLNSAIAGDEGFSILETLIVLSIIAILIAAAAFSFVGWQEKYRAETIIKNLYSDVMKIRARAMLTGRMNFLVINSATPATYRIYEDINNDGALTVATDFLNSTTPSTGTLNLNLQVVSGTVNIPFDTRGMARVSATENVRVVTTNQGDADYDCIEIRQTRVKMGVWNTPTAGACNVK